MARLLKGKTRLTYLVSRFSGPSSALPISLKRTVLAPSVLMMILLNS
jgi:hypothetical protein